MRSNTPSGFQHGPRWFRRYAPTVILLIGVTAFILVVVGIGLGDGSHGASDHKESDKTTVFQAESSTASKQEKPKDADSLLQRARHLTYGVCRALFFHNEIEKEPEKNGLILSGEILVAASAAMVGLGVVFLLGHKLQLWWYTRKGRHVVICGLGERIGLPLARAYRTTTARADRRKVIAITLEPDAPHRRHSIEALRDLGGVIVLQGDATDPTLLKLANVAGADRVFAVTSDDAKNLEIAMAVADVAPNSGRAPHCHVHIDDQARAGLLIDRLQQLPGLCETETFCLRHQITRTLVRGLFADNTPGVGANAHIVLLGFGPMGQEIARELAAQSHFLNHRRLRLTVADRPIDVARDAFLARSPAFCPAPGTFVLEAWDERLDRWDSIAHQPSARPVAEAQASDFEHAKAASAVEYVCSAEFLEMPDPIGTGGFIAHLRQRLAHSEIGAVVVCTEDMPRNAEIALALQTELNPARPLTVWVWLPKGDAFARLMAPAPKEKGPLVRLVPFGLAADELANPQQLVQAAFEQEAREAHAAYIEQRKAAGKYDDADESMRKWDELPARTRDENRNQVAQAALKREALRAAGVELVHGSEPASTDNTSVAPVIEALAELEHNRWMADKLLHGFRYAPVTDKPARLHSLLVPFASLTEAAKEQDRDIVRQMLAGRLVRRSRPTEKTQC